MKRVLLILILALLVVLIALPALGQTEPVPDEGPTSGDILAGIIVFGAMVKWLIDFIKRTIPAVQGTLTQVVALVLGFGVAASLDFRAAGALLEKYELAGVIGRPPASAFDWLITGGAIAAASGVFAAFMNKATVNNTTTLSAVPRHGAESHR